MKSVQKTSSRRSEKLKNVVSMFTRTLVVPIAAFLLFAVPACKDEPIDRPSGDEKELYPCEGPWCFDSERSDIQDLLQDAYDTYGPEFTDMYREVYEACRYTEGSGGEVVVECPDWVHATYGGGGVCPQNWFKITSAFGSVRPGDDDNAVYCFPETDQTVALANAFLCAGGYVQAGQAAGSFADQVSGKASRGSCLRPEDCLIMEGLRWPSKEKSCFYSDFSHASEGVPSAVECASLAEGECSIQCACPEPNVAVVGHVQACHFLSANRDVGVCGYAACADDTWCSIEGVVEGRCLQRTPLPEWAEAFQNELNTELRSPQKWGTCVERSAFENWRSRADDAFQYGDVD